MEHIHAEKLKNASLGHLRSPQTYENQIRRYIVQYRNGEILKKSLIGYILDDIDGLQYIANLMSMA